MTLKLEIPGQIKKKLKKYGVGLGTNWLGIGFTVITQVAFARLLGASEYGRLSLSLALVLLPLAVADLGVAASTPRFLALNIGKDRYGDILAIAKKTAFVTGVIAFLYLCVMMFLRPYIVEWMNIPKADIVLRYLIIFSPGIYLSRWTFSVLKGVGFIRLQIFLESTLLRIFILLFGGSAWYFFGSTSSIAIGYGLSYFISGTIGLFFCLKELNRFRKIGDTSSFFKLKELILHGIPINLTGLAQRFLGRCDIIVIGALLDESSVGLYKVAMTITKGIQRLIKPLNTFALFYMSKKAGEGANHSIFQYYNKIVNFSICLSLPLYFLIFRHTKMILALVYSPEYVAAASVTKVLCVGFAFSVAMGPMGAVFNAIGKNWIRMMIVLAVGVVNLILNIVFIKVFGLVGVAFATSICFFLLYVLFHLSFRSMQVGFKKGNNSFAMVFIGMLLAVILETSILKSNNIIYILLSCLSFTLVCALPSVNMYKLLKS